MNENRLIRFLPKKWIPHLKGSFDQHDLWLKLYLLFSRKRLSSAKSCFSFRDIDICVNDVRYAFDPYDSIQRRILLNLYEPESLKRVRAIFDTPGIFLDIGANIGFYSLNLSLKSPDCQKVYAIEADPAVYRRLEKNRTLNSLQQKIELHHLAICETEGELVFHQNVDERCSGAGSLNAYPDLCSQEVVVPASTLDAFLAKEKIEEVQCAKVDIEGSEIELFRGAQKALSKGMINHWLVEYNGSRIYERGASFLEFFSYFPQRNYRCTFNKALFESMIGGEVDPRTVCENFMFSRQ